MSTILGPLRNHMRNKLHGPLKNYQETTNHLVSVVAKVDPKFDELKEAVQEDLKARTRLDNALAEFFRSYPQISGTAKELEGINIADIAADSAQIAELTDGLVGIEYTVIAAHLEMATVETLEQAFSELASYQDGAIYLDKVQEALDRVR